LANGFGGYSLAPGIHDTNAGSGCGKPESALVSAYTWGPPPEEGGDFVSIDRTRGGEAGPWERMT
jgi:hypothetical protein